MAVPSPRSSRIPFTRGILPIGRKGDGFDILILGIQIESVQTASYKKRERKKGVAGGLGDAMQTARRIR